MASTSMAAERRVVAGFAQQAGMIAWVVGRNLDGVDHCASLVAAQPGGNCINWVLGHLVEVYESVLPMLGQERVLDDGALARYARGTEPLTEAAEALPLGDLRATWTETAARFAAGLESLTEEALGSPAPFSPGDDPNETVGSLLLTVLFHQTYHAGQLGLLRRLVGLDGAIR